MLFTSINGFGHSFGAATPGRPLVQGTDYNCNASICYAIGAANHALFQQLQQTLNQYARLGLSAYRSQLTVDGFIGAQTVSAAQAAAAAALLASPGSTKQAVAANAQILNNGLQAFLAGVNAPKVPAPVPVATAPLSPSTPTIQTSQGAVIVQPAAQPLPQAAAAATSTIPTSLPAPDAAAALPSTATSKVPLWVWITAGAVGVVAIGGIGYALLREPEPTGLARRRRRR